ncbi:RAD23 protein, partial [Trifolium medium]|nr:RAD23 protein [Trifolium medium]
TASNPPTTVPTADSTPVVQTQSANDNASAAVVATTKYGFCLYVFLAILFVVTNVCCTMYHL